MIDTHTHLNDKEAYPDGEGAACVRRAIQAGVDHVILAGVDIPTIESMQELQQEFPENVSLMLGIHPTEISDNWEEDLFEIERLLPTMPGVVAVGEIGIDLHEEGRDIELQKEVFRRQLRMAARLHLPVNLHQRDGLEATLECLREADLKAIPSVVFHCFTEGPETVRRVREVVPDAYFGIGGVCTFKNAKAVREALHEIGLDRIVLETDAPYLSPTPFRGQRNESARIPLIATAIAAELGTTAVEVAEITDRNAREIFDLT